MPKERTARGSPTRRSESLSSSSSNFSTVVSPQSARSCPCCLPPPTTAATPSRSRSCPPCTLVGVLAKLAETDSELAPALTKALRHQLDTAVTARNQATHEVLGQLLKERTGVLLSLIDEIVCAPGLTPLLDP